MKKIKEWGDLERYVRAEEDQELMIAINFVRKYGDSSLKVFNRIVESVKNTKEEEADIIFSTAHRAKGREFSHVIVNADFNPQKNIEEQNLYYVAVTRAKHFLTIIKKPKNKEQEGAEEN